MKRPLSMLLASSVLLSGCLPRSVIIKRKPEGTVRVAVLPFADAPGRPGSGRAATEAMTTHLLKVPDYELIERGQLEKILKEQKLGMSGAVDAATAKEIGKIAGADAIVVGSVTEVQDRRWLLFPPAKATVAARMVSVERGTVDWTATYTSGWSGVKWVFSVLVWPLGVVLALTSPSAEDHIGRSSRGIASHLAAQPR